MKKKFLLCMGAQKAGTTILHELISQLDDVNFGFLKEYKVLNATKPATLIYELKFQDFFGKKGIKSLKIISLYLIAKIKECFTLLFSKHLSLKIKLMRILMKAIPFFYEGYFNIIAKNKKITGDFSPSNSLLTYSQLNILKRNLSFFGFEIILIYIIRDPIERSLSMIRMQRKRKTLHKWELNEKFSNVQILEKLYKNKKFLAPSNYVSTIENIRKSILKNKTLFLINEELNFSINKINSFLGINLKMDSFSIKKHSHDFGNDIVPEKIYNEIVLYFKDIYLYCFDLFPQTKILWNKPYLILKNNNLVV